MFGGVAVALQELGHNLDYHDSWNPYPHDPHSPLMHLARGIVSEGFSEAPVLGAVAGLPAGVLALDVAVDARTGDVWMTGSDLGIYKKERLSSTWVQAPGGAVRIAVDGQGRPWVVNLYGQVYRKGSSDPTANDWTFLAGSARDIGIGGKDREEVWIIGTKPVFGGADFEILRRNQLTNTWEASDGGGGVRIAVDSRGMPCGSPARSASFGGRPLSTGPWCRSVLTA